MSFHLHLDTERVEHVDFDEPICVTPTTTLGDVLDLLHDSEQGSVLICEEGRLTGLFTERDALRLLAANADMAESIGPKMTTEPVATSPSETVGAAITKMAVGGYRRLPVVDDASKPIGLLRVEHILHYLVEHFPEVVYNLPPKSKHTMQAREGA